MRAALPNRGPAVVLEQLDDVADLPLDRSQRCDMADSLLFSHGKQDASQATWSSRPTRKPA
jgi:hypothetical protein